MFEKDWSIVEEAFKQIPNKHSLDEEKDFINPYQNKVGAQKKCKHMWGNDTDAFYVCRNGRRKCAICGKEF